MGADKKIVAGFSNEISNIFPIERIARDLRLASIWTGAKEIMSMIIALEWYREYFKMKEADLTRDIECDAPGTFELEEKVYE